MNQTQQMTKEELLIPRSIYMFHDPYQTFGQGDILTGVISDTANAEKIYNEHLATVDSRLTSLKWWELRKIEDMPEYVIAMGWENFQRDRPGSIVFKAINKMHPVYKIKQHLTSGFIVYEYGKDRIMSYYFGQFIPATKEQYDEFAKVYNQ